MRTPMIQTVFVASLALGIAACGDDPQLGPGEILAVTSEASPTAQRLLAFDRTSPGSIRQNTSITGIPAAERIVGIDLRPVDGVLWALAIVSAAADKLYTIDVATGAATLICTLSTDPANPNVAIDFNPVANALRIVADTGQNLRVPPASLLGPGGACAVTTDTALTTAGAARTGITAAGYTNSVSGAVASTTLYYIDTDEAAGADRLTISGAPNDGVVANVGGTLGFDIVTATALDIAGTANVATLTGVVGAATVSSIFSLDLVTGAATLLGVVGDTIPLAGITSRTRP